MKSKRRIRPRERSRGVAVLELTLSLIYLVPLMMATLDFGYYFYIGATAEEAARQGVKQAVLIGGACPGVNVPCPPAVNNAVTPTANGGSFGVACNTAGDAACYLNAPPLGMGTNANTTVTCTCTNAVVNPTFTISVQVDFLPAAGYFRFLLPKPPGPGNNVRYTATQTGN
jgi:TadE-like protein